MSDFILFLELLTLCNRLWKIITGFVIVIRDYNSEVKFFVSDKNLITRMFIFISLRLSSAVLFIFGSVVLLLREDSLCRILMELIL